MCTAGGKELGALVLAAQPSGKEEKPEHNETFFTISNKYLKTFNCLDAGSNHITYREQRKAVQV